MKSILKLFMILTLVVVFSACSEDEKTRVYVGGKYTITNPSGVSEHHLRLAFANGDTLYIEQAILTTSSDTCYNFSATPYIMSPGRSSNPDFELFSGDTFTLTNNSEVLTGKAFENYVELPLPGTTTPVRMDNSESLNIENPIFTDDNTVKPLCTIGS